MHTIDEWLKLCANNTRNVDPADLGAIATNCFVAERANENCSVWHQVALYFNKPCHCAACKR